MTLAIVGTKNQEGHSNGDVADLIAVVPHEWYHIDQWRKTILAALFANGKKVLSVKFISLSVLLPLILLAGIYWYQYNEFEVPRNRPHVKLSGI